MHQPRRKPENDDVEKTSDDHSKNQRERDKRARVLDQTAHVSVLSDDGGEFEDGEVHADDHASDQTANNHHDERLKQARQSVNSVVDFLLVEFGDLEQHFVERAGLFADSDHLHNHIRKQADLTHRERS